MCISIRLFAYEVELFLQNVLPSGFAKNNSEFG